MKSNKNKVTGEEMNEESNCVIHTNSHLASSVNFHSQTNQRFDLSSFHCLPFTLAKSIRLEIQSKIALYCRMRSLHEVQTLDMPPVGRVLVVAMKNGIVKLVVQENI